MKKNSTEAAVDAYEMPFHRRSQPVCLSTNQSVLTAQEILEPVEPGWLN